MKTGNAAVLLAFLAFSLAASAATSAIRHVELFPSGAAVTRSVEVDGAEVLSLTVEVADLPSSLIASSVQITPSTMGVLVGGFVFLPQENPVKEDDPRTAELRDAIKGIDDQMRLLRLEKQAIEQRIGYYADVAASIRKSLEEASSGEGFDLAKTSWKSLEEVRADGEARMPALDVEMKKQGIRREELQKELNDLVGKLRQRSGVLKFDLSGDLSGGVDLLLRYQIRDAGWQPVHEIRANPAEGVVEWVYKARIRQSTGEDWNSVKVTLNSASALYAGGLPQLDPLFLQRMEARPLVARSYPQRAEAVYSMDAAAPMAEMEAAPESTTTGFYMHLPEPLSLESGKEPAVRAAFTGTLKADFWSEAVPELSTEAWLMAGMTNDLGWPILAGESYSYIDGQLVARRGIKGISAGEEIEFSLGVNEKIAIERKERVKEESQGGLIDKTKKHQIKYETTVENRMPVAHKIVLQDRFPVGRDNKIQVRTISPKDVEPEEGTGLFKWEREVAPGAKTVMTTEYIVTYPAEWTLFPPL
jgi:uncharacterized protein (TIGR02231 family)